MEKNLEKNSRKILETQKIFQGTFEEAEKNFKKNIGQTEYFLSFCDKNKKIKERAENSFQGKN